MRIDPAGWPFVIGGLAAALILALAAGPVAGLIVAGLSAFFLFFFRDPDRAVKATPDVVLSPADGRVMVAGPSVTADFPASAWQQVSIFLSPMDVHVNRIPVGGRVMKVAYHPGRFLPAYKQDAGSLNEHTEVTIDHDGQRIVVRQIVGVLARRIVCRVQEGDVVAAGDRFGVMKFGSRMDLFLPPDASLNVRIGDRVVGGVTTLAVLGPGVRPQGAGQARDGAPLTTLEA